MEPLRGGRDRRRAFTALALSYAVVWCLPGALAEMDNESKAGTTPGYSDVDGRLEPCHGIFCPTPPHNIALVLLTTALALTPSLLVSVPLYIHLVRKWGTPRLAGVISALLGWLALCAGYWAWLTIRAS